MTILVVLSEKSTTLLVQVAVVPDTDISEMHLYARSYAGESGIGTAADAIFPTAKDAERTAAQSKDVTLLIN